MECFITFLDSVFTLSSVYGVSTRKCFQVCKNPSYYCFCQVELFSLSFVQFVLPVAAIFVTVTPHFTVQGDTLIISKQTWSQHCSTSPVFTAVLTIISNSNLKSTTPVYKVTIVYTQLSLCLKLQTPQNCK